MSYGVCGNRCITSRVGPNPKLVRVISEKGLRAEIVVNDGGIKRTLHVRVRGDHYEYQQTVPTSEGHNLVETVFISKSVRDGDRG